MGAIPGMPAEMLAGAEQEGGKRMKRMMCIMDSMTDEGNKSMDDRLKLNTF